MELKKLQRERDQLRRVFNRHEQTAATATDLEFLNEKMSNLLILDKAIQTQMVGQENFVEDEYDEECATADDFHKRWLELKQRLAEKCSNDPPKNGNKSHNLNLPKLEIRKFDDNPKSWLAFWGQYKKIHEDSTMDAETKFQYLTQAMTPGSAARNLVESYPPTEENYPKIIKTLKDRFAKDETLVEIYVRELLKLVSHKNQVTLSVLCDKIVSNLQILESLGIIRDKYECILLPMIESALPESTLLAWSKIPCKTGEPKLTRLLEFIETEVEAERRVQLAKSEFLDSSMKVPTAECLLAATNQAKKSTGYANQKEGDNKEKKVRALLDSGSQRTYIRTKLAEELGLKVKGSEVVSHSLFGGVKKASQTHKIFEFQVSNLENTYNTKMTALQQDMLCGMLPKVESKGLIEKLQDHQIHLTDGDRDVVNIKEIDILIGSDYLGIILEDVLVHINEKLVAVKTKLGWTLQGPVETGINNHVVHTNLTMTATPDIQNNIQFLWDMETLGIKDPYQKGNNETPLDIAVNHEGRYEVNLIWKEAPELESNYDQASKRLISTTKKLENMKGLEGYDQVIKEWENEGIIEAVQNDNVQEGCYLPHHAVIKLQSTTTKIRPVFDASCKDKNKRSLNSCIEKGTNLIELIPKILMIFRARQYGVIADIKKAFLQISIAPEDRKYLKLLWWKDPQKKDEIMTFQHARVPFGVACSPYLLAATLKYHLEKYTDMYSDTTKRLRESFYVDNCVTSFDSKEELFKFIEEASEVMKKGKFELRGWMTNLEEENKEEETVSVLGIQWNRTEDNLHCNLNLKTVPDNITKRSLLSITQQIFDPIGFLCPMTLVPKLIIQKAWLLQTGWDEAIPMELENEYKEWVCAIDHLKYCRIPRRLSVYQLNDCKATVHIFCDASKDAYAGCVFLRTEKENKVNVRLITAKSRVAPIKRQMTLPRLELMGALIASRMYNEVVSSGLLSASKEHKVYCWTDSAVVLAWIQRQETWKAFVTNRVKEICMNTKKDEWNHLPGTYNPADLPSRGCNTKTLLETRWWSGPSWLYLKKEEWPKSIINDIKIEEENVISSEQKKSIAVNVEITIEMFSEKLLYFSKYKMIVRLVARLLRMHPQIRRKYHKGSIEIGFEEYKNAEETLIRLIQKESYDDKNKIEKKLVTKEEKGIIKVKTRLDYSEEEQSFISPILLPGKNVIVQRMVQEKHRKMNHAGTQTLMAELRNTYWITGVRRLVKNVVSKCIICKRYKAKHYVVPEPPLPVDRIRTSAPFEVTGIDLAGPLYLKNNIKCWIVLYTCAVYRAIHLELTESLSTASFIMTLRRFIARRGRVKIIYSDNGTNFVGTANLLRELNWQEIEEATCDQIQWKFIPPASPWWGGWWERLVRVTKEMLRGILGKACVSWIELTTILCDCESTINSRPLTYTANDDDTLRPLTPMMFLNSLSTSETPDLDKIDEEHLQVRYKYLQQLRKDFRKRFKNEYLSLLIGKGRESGRELTVGEVVLVETDTSRLNWPLGVIIDTCPGKDGLTRVARVRTASGIKVRPHQRLFPLELSTTSQEWLDNIPVPCTAEPADAGRQQEPDDSQNVPLRPATTSRSGRTIKMPFRFLE